VSLLALAAATYDWHDHSACRDTDPDLFFPVGTTARAQAQVARAKSICAECTVRSECLDYALDTNQDAGVWGGLSEEERRDIRRARRRQNLLVAAAN
jgi:WhiB family transcriptional regulator, redox-sensing transcriptional regulator